MITYQGKQYSRRDIPGNQNVHAELLTHLKPEIVKALQKWTAQDLYRFLHGSETLCIGSRKAEYLDHAVNNVQRQIAHFPDDAILEILDCGIAAFISMVRKDIQEKRRQENPEVSRRRRSEGSFDYSG